MFSGAKFCKRLHSASARTALLLAASFACGSFAFAGPIQDAARKGDVKKVKELLQQDPKLLNDKDKNGDTALHQAALHGQTAVVQALLDAGADPNLKNSYPPYLPDDLGQFFQSSNHADPIRLLHSQAANSSNELNTQGITAGEGRDNGYAPIQLAEFSNSHNKIVQLLVAHKADVNIQGASGATALFFAVLRDQKDDVKFLLDHGANPNLADAFKTTPLIAAVQLGYQGLVQPLVDKGADVNAQDQTPHRALSYAMQNNEDTAVEILKKHGAHE